MDPQNIPSAFWTWLIDVLPSKGKSIQHHARISLVNLLTVNHIPHILKKAMDDLEGMHRRYPSLISSEPIQPPKYRLDVLPPQEQLLDKRSCVA